MLLDSYAYNKICKDINITVSYYIIGSFAYYEQDNPIFTDRFFDKMASIMIDRWEDIEHYYKPFISLSDLDARTYSGEYPSILEGALQNLRDFATPTN